MGEWKKTQWAMCVLSCGLEMEVEDSRIVNVRPDPASPRSHGYCCRKGRTAKLHLENPERLDYPLKKVGDHFERISWEQANREIAQRANQILAAHGPRSVAFVGGALTSAQAELVFGRGFMAAIIATGNHGDFIRCRSHHAPTVAFRQTPLYCVKPIGTFFIQLKWGRLKWRPRLIKGYSLYRNPSDCIIHWRSALRAQPSSSCTGRHRRAEPAR